MDLSHGSLFAGVGGFDMGMERAGWETRWQVEWDPKAQAVLARHWPRTARYSDVRDVDGASLEPVACITFGSPCTDLSTAGRRAGLAGERSGLFHEAIRVIKEMRHATDGRYPRWAIWENVAGAFSSNGGADFLTVLEEMAELGAHHLEWSLLDARYFGVPQRRRRVFVIACLDPRTARACPAPLLPVSDRGTRGAESKRPTKPSAAPGARRGAPQRRGGVPDVAGALTAQGVGTCGADSNQASAGHLVPVPVSVSENQRGELRTADYAMALTAGGRKMGQGMPTVLVPSVIDEAVAPRTFDSLASSEVGGSIMDSPGAARTLISRPLAVMVPSQPTTVAETEQGTVVGPDSPDGAFEPYTFDASASSHVDTIVDAPGVARTLVSKRPLAVMVPAGPMVVAETGQGFYTAIDDGATAGTLTARCQKSMEQYVLDMPPVAGPAGSSDAVAYPVARRGRADGWEMELGEADVANTLRAADGGSSRSVEVVTPQMSVRRLMPVECERLMGWPDDHTRFAADGTEIADSHRYRMCGNGVASPVAEWIGGHVAAADLAAGNRRPRPHPAAFSEPLIPVMAKMLVDMGVDGGCLVDPFAGIGRGAAIAELAGMAFAGVEIEPEWAMQHPAVICGDSRNLPFPDETFSGAASSPAYANRLADSYAGSPSDEAELRAGRKIKRRTYRVFLGRPLSPGSGAGMQWGEEYRELHRRVWAEVMRCLKPGAPFVVNVKDHFRNDELQPVVAWHIETLESLGMVLEHRCEVGTRHYTVGSAGSKKRAPEMVLGFRKPVAAGRLPG